MTSSTGLQLTDRDVAMLRDLGRFGVLAAAQLARRYYPESTTPETCRNRLLRLRQAGYLERVVIANGVEHAYLPTARGVATAGLDAPAPQRRGLLPMYLVHHLVVADVADALLTPKDGKRYAGGAASWLTERELRQGMADDWFPRARKRGEATFYPDGVLVLTPPDGDPAYCAVEVELHQKTAGRLAPKLKWYADRLNDGTFAAVWWRIADRATFAAVQRVVAANGGDADQRIRLDALPDHVVVPGLDDRRRARPLPPAVLAVDPEPPAPAPASVPSVPPVPVALPAPRRARSVTPRPSLPVPQPLTTRLKTWLLKPVGDPRGRR